MKIYACIIEANQPLCIGDSRRFWLFYLDNLSSYSQRLLNYLSFSFFDFDRTWWWLFQKITTMNIEMKKALIIHILLKSTKVWIKIWD